jgi:RimJ/RimL family protein N-acetyltransferase
MREESNILATPRLALRPFEPGDLDDLARLFADPDVMRFLSATGAVRSREESAQALAAHLAHWQERGYGIGAVFERATGAFVGRCGLRYMQQYNEIELLYTFHRAFWNRGYGTEAARAVVRQAFETLRLERIIAFCLVENSGSRRVMEKAGLRFEKTAPHADLPHHWYALHRHEYQTTGDAHA